MTDCKHRNLRSCFWKDSGESAGMWSCVECERKFVPLDIEQEQDAGRYRWLRANGEPDADMSYRADWCDANYDAAIDTAMKLDAQPVQPDEQAAFETWLAEKCPSGDVTDVQRQWEESSDYADMAQPVQPKG